MFCAPQCRVIWQVGAGVTEGAVANVAVRSAVLLTRNREVLGPTVECRGWCFHGFPQSIQTNARAQDLMFSQRPY